MSDIVISVQNLSKRYTLKHEQASGTGLRHAIQDRLNAPMRWLREKAKSEKRKGESALTCDLRPLTSGPAASSTEEEFWALKDVSFEVKRGEVLGVIGRNGAGKSTLLKILSRIAEPTCGKIEINGRVASLLEVGTGFHPELSGRENIFLNGAILGMSRGEIRKQFQNIVDFAEIERFLDTPVKRYSSGMYVRLAFAVAAHLEPEILIVDEVLAVGDVAFQRKCLGKIRDVSRADGRTVLFVSHNMAAIRMLCTRCICLRRGQIEADGPVDHALSNYLDTISENRTAETVLPPAEPNLGAQALKLELLDAKNTPQIQFQLCATWTAILHFTVTKSFGQLIAAVGLKSMEGTPITTWWSQPQDLLPGTYRVSFVCDVNLSAGGYDFVVGISSNASVLYYTENVSQIEIGEIAAGQQPHRARGSGLIISTQRPEIYRIT